MSDCQARCDANGIKTLVNARRRPPGRSEQLASFAHRIHRHHRPERTLGIMARNKLQQQSAAVQPAKGKKITFGDDADEGDFEPDYEPGPSTRSRAVQQASDSEEEDDDVDDDDDDAPEAAGVGREEADQVSDAADLLAQYVPLPHHHRERAEFQLATVLILRDQTSARENRSRSITVPEDRRSPCSQGRRGRAGKVEGERQQETETVSITRR